MVNVVMSRDVADDQFYLEVIAKGKSFGKFLVLSFEPHSIGNLPEYQKALRDAAAFDAGDTVQKPIEDIQEAEIDIEKSFENVIPNYEEGD